MAGLTELLGEKLLRKGIEVGTQDALEGKAAVALYFSAHWCPPCRGFTPKLAEWYNKDLKEKGLEVVFISSDKDEDAFKEYYGEQPWLALPYSDRERKDSLSKKYKVQGIPTLVVLGPSGELINKEGRDAITNDPTGEDMPWKPKTFLEVFSDAKVLGKVGTYKGSDLLGTVFGLYFSAHWCPPCRGFTPQLAGWYNAGLNDKGFEVVFVSSDKDEAAFQEYFAEQPWLALDFADRKRKSQLSDMFGVSGIPSLVIIDKDGSVITKEGRTAVSSDPTGAEFPWHPKPVSNLKGGVGTLQEVPTVIAFCETSDAGTKASVEAAMEPIARTFKEEAKAKGNEEPEVAFVIVTDNGGLAPRIRQMLKLDALPLAKHEHPLEKCDRASGWGCDGCQASGEGKERYHCTQGCDFDFCEECNAKAGAEVKALPPQLMLIDIPDNGGFYEGPSGKVTNGVVQKLVDDYLAKSLSRKQLE